MICYTQFGIEDLNHCDNNSLTYENEKCMCINNMHTRDGNTMSLIEPKYALIIKYVLHDNTILDHSLHM